MKDSGVLEDECRMLPATKDQVSVRFFRPSQVARITNASKSEVHRWITSGRLKAIRPEGSMSWYIPVDALEEFMSGERAA